MKYMRENGVYELAGFGMVIKLGPNKPPAFVTPGATPRPVQFAHSHAVPASGLSEAGRA